MASSFGGVDPAVLRTGSRRGPVSTACLEWGSSPSEPTLFTLCTIGKYYGTDRGAVLTSPEPRERYRSDSIPRKFCSGFLFFFLFFFFNLMVIWFPWCLRGHPSKGSRSLPSLDFFPSLTLLKRKPQAQDGITLVKTLSQ